MWQRAPSPTLPKCKSLLPSLQFIAALMPRSQRCSLYRFIIIVARNRTCTPAIATAQLKTGHELLYHSNH